MEYTQALEIATRLLEKLEPFCDRAAIAGSVRRKKPVVHDIEICAIPKMTTGRNLFNEPVLTHDISHAVSGFGRFIKNGPRYKQIYLPEGIILDLFLVIPPAQWGYLLSLRTGPADFSRLLVTPRQKRGWLPSHSKAIDGMVVTGQTRVLMPEEVDYFEFCGLPFIEPEKREDYLKDYQARRVFHG